ncbi:unnamed protein product [Arctia plantaginis]|uniref:Uncharacterized protein n=1 Tax=Arctia plantaginis TaxID=874455 RepID=A0A8S0ZUV5_ARCPL|nr:unnamed protein product [Arctia plantaginis]
MITDLYIEDKEKRLMRGGTLHQFLEVIRASSGWSESRPQIDTAAELSSELRAVSRHYGAAVLYVEYVVKPFVGSAIRMLIVSLKQPQLYFSFEKLTHTHMPVV